MEIHLLDVGTREYGDCIIVHNNSKRILIDGAHLGDSELLKKQMNAIFGQEAPYHFDLLVMTHLHSDHIGCLPELVKNGDITAGKCLLMNPNFRWKASAGNIANPNDALVDALLEEDHSFLSDDELRKFLADSALLVDRYKEMIKKLKKDSKVILFNGVDAKDYKPLEKEFSSLGLKIIGPTKKHLKITKDALMSLVDTLTDTVRSSALADSASSDVDLYRKLYTGGMIDSALVRDAVQSKGAINDESIVLKFRSKGANSWSALVAGDMQFAVPEVSGIDDEMNKLLDKANGKGPYDFIKTSHHTSYNGLSEQMIDHWIQEGTALYGHSGGLYDPSHPEPDVLKFLKDRKENIKFVRTDRNGLIRVANDDEGVLSLWISKGDINTFTKNKDKPQDDDASVTKGPGEPVTFKSGFFTQTDGNQIQFAAVIPENKNVRIIIEVDGEKKNLSETHTVVQGQKNRFDRLIFVTSSEKLIKNIGKAETDKVIAYIKSIANTKFVDLPILDNPKEAARKVRKYFEPDTRGIVIIGGYDVVPSVQLNVLSDALLKEIENDPQSESEEWDVDEFIVWSDDIYGDIEGDLLPELPVSRIPDGKNPELILSALKAPLPKIQGKYGVRNIKRPFAIDVFEKVPFSTEKILEVSEACSPKTVKGKSVNGAVYFMLHGHDGDATRFTGELGTKTGYFEAFDIYNVPANCDGTVVFTGCCYGALIALPKADRREPGMAVRSRTHEQSIALAFLNAGVNAFVGCTGAHYSPRLQNENFFGKPMHLSFWNGIQKGLAPAEALLEAKKEYATNIPHGLTKAIYKAIEVKILHQFTCLGIGW